VLAIAMVVSILGLLLRDSSGAQGRREPAAAPGRATVCLYTRDGVNGLQRAARYLGVSPACSVIFHRAARTWSEWDDPWFVTTSARNDNWGGWAATKGRTLVISMSLFPASAVKRNWRANGAAGHYDGYARVLARNLVAAGLAHAIVRLSPEANGPWFPDNLGTTRQSRLQWLALWRHEARAMLSVPGARFRFDWTVANGTGRLPLRSFYPGNDLVSYVGDDIYDVSYSNQGAARIDQLASETGGLDSILDFAGAHHKQFSVPEWGLVPRPGGGGDDPAFIRWMTTLAHEKRVAYECYFFAGTSRTAMLHAPKSRAAFRAGFGNLP
jgi:hypothetical protein